MYWDSYKNINEELYPIQPTSTASEIEAFVPNIYRCYNPSLSYFRYPEYSVPNLEKEGYAIRFNDPYEILTTKSATIFTMTNQTITLGIIPKVSKIDESLIKEGLEMYVECFHL